MWKDDIGRFQRLVDHLPGVKKHRDAPCVCVCVCFFFPSILGIKFIGRSSRGHTAFFIHLPSAVRALICLARRIQPFLSLVDREVKLLCTNDLIVLHPLGIFSFLFSFLVRKIPITGIELTSQRVRRLKRYQHRYLSIVVKAPIPGQGTTSVASETTIQRGYFGRRY